MSDADQKQTLHRYLQLAREVLLWKLDGLNDHDIRRPLVPTGTNLLGLVKHVATVEAEYFSTVFGRPSAFAMPWADDEAEPNADMWATADEPRDRITALYRGVWAQSDATIDALALDAPGHVPWWGDRGAVRLHTVLVHMIAETNRHAGHADIVREMVDGSAGHRAGVSNLPDEPDAPQWAAHHARVAQAAAAFLPR